MGSDCWPTHPSLPGKSSTKPLNSSSQGNYIFLPRILASDAPAIQSRWNWKIAQWKSNKDQNTKVPIKLGRLQSLSFSAHFSSINFSIGRYYLRAVIELKSDWCDVFINRAPTEPSALTFSFEWSFGVFLLNAAYFYEPNIWGKTPNEKTQLPTPSYNSQEATKDEEWDIHKNKNN